MPRLVDYASRFHFFREAAFALVRRSGVDALSRRALAGELGLNEGGIRRLLAPDADLATLAADHVAERRRSRRWKGPHLEHERAGVRQLGGLLPHDSLLVDEEVVWWRLVLASIQDPAPDPEGDLRDRFTTAAGGWVEPGTSRPVNGGDQDDPGTRQRQLRREALAQALDERDEDVRAVVTQVVGTDEAAQVLLTAVLDGLTLGVCRGRIEPGVVADLRDRYLAT